MPVDHVFQGSLFTYDLLQDSVVQLPDWQDLDDHAVDALGARLRAIFNRFPVDKTPNESQTEDDLIWPVLAELNWTATLRQQNLAARGREDVPDGLLFADDKAKARANRFAEEWKRYGLGLAIVESKRWLRPLDRRSGRRGEETAPSTQMLRYLRRAEDLAGGSLRWGILTNGVRWRLYWQGARSVSEQFFEVDLATVLDLPGHNQGLFALDADERRHWLKLFILIFRRDAFLPSGPDPRTFHQRALEEGRFYEQRVAGDLSDLVFVDVFPELARAIAAAAPDATFEEMREGALVLLYRLLFILYAEDRDLLPVRDPRYGGYGLRENVRGDVGRRKDQNDVFSPTAARYWGAVDDLCRAINDGDTAIGLPPYNGGLFDPDRTPLLARIRIGDAVMAHVIDRLSFERTSDGRKYINYRDLGVRQLGSIYERLLEHEIVHDGDGVAIRPNIFARKSSGSYYTPDDLVGLILRETVGPLADRPMESFMDKVDELAAGDMPDHRRIAALKGIDPAERILDLKVCDPAMGSGHFLVGLVDTLTDQVLAAMADAEMLAPAEWGDYVSPLSERIDRIRFTIQQNAERRGWTVDDEQLDDRHIVRRMVLKRCVYGVDKNPMAVELAKVSLWLHTFTVGAPLSFLDHHLRCGDSLFGGWVRSGVDRAAAYGTPLLLHGPVRRALRAASKMQIIEGLTDAEIAEAHRSADVFAEVEDMTAPLAAFLALVHALDWLDIRGVDDRRVLRAFFDGQFGDPVEIARGNVEPDARRDDGHRFADILDRAHTLITEERFLAWQVAFPGIWQNWEDEGLTGGFDAVIGNPPWDRMKLQQVEWFAARRREIAMQQRAADRKRMIAELQANSDPLSGDYNTAANRAETAARVARKSGDYPLLSAGDVNLYSLFVERAAALVRPDGRVGLLTPSGIASDLTAARFFKSVATEGRLGALYDFENRRTRYGAAPFFPDVDSRFKFCVIVFGPSVTERPAQCASFLQDLSELSDPERCFPLSAADFARVNPNTGTAPVFRSRRDAALTTAIYSRLPVLVDRSDGEPARAWPVRYLRMFDMTNDSGLFRTRQELEATEGAWPAGGNRFDSPRGRWTPLYVGRMIHQFDHRAGSVTVNEGNIHNAALTKDVEPEEKADPKFVSTPQFWVLENEVAFPAGLEWAIAFRDIARATDARTMIAALLPKVGVGNTAPILVSDDTTLYRHAAPLLLANLNSVPLDFAARQKAQSTHLNWYIVEQLPVVPPDRFDAVRFGAKTAGEIVREAVLELTYTADDMAPFARDMGHVAADGTVPPPFAWNDERRLHLRARLDAVFFHLYGVTDRDDVRYVFSTFPIVERHDRAAWGDYRSCELCLAYMNALAAGRPDAEVAM